MKKSIEKVEGEIIFEDYPDKFAKKIDWWKSEQGLSLIKGWRMQGKTINQIIGLMGVDPRTFRSWRKKYGEFDEALTVGSEVANANVTKSLYKRAMGYEYWEETWELVEGEMMCVRKNKKHIPPDTKAILSWLYNRMPGYWRSIQEPLENTQYKDTVKDILIAMKEVAETGESKVVDADGLQ